MKNTILRAAAAVSLAAAVLLAPTAANAYVDPSAITATPSTIAPGESSTFTTPGTPFTGNEDVLISITGESASGATLGMVKTAVETNSNLHTSANAGKLNVRITFPSNAREKRWDRPFGRSHLSRPDGWRSSIRNQRTWATSIPRR